jgi:hypothetical protein
MLKKLFSSGDRSKRTIGSVIGGAVGGIPGAVGGFGIGNMVKNKNDAERSQQDMMNTLVEQQYNARQRGAKEGEAKSNELFGSPAEALARRNAMRGTLETQAQYGSGAGDSSARYGAAMRAARSATGSAGIRGGAAAQIHGNVAAQSQLAALNDVQASKQAAQNKLLAMSNQELMGHSTLPLAYQAGAIADQNAMAQLQLQNKTAGGWFSNVPIVGGAVDSIFGGIFG